MSKKSLIETNRYLQDSEKYRHSLITEAEIDFSMISENNDPPFFKPSTLVNLRDTSTSLHNLHLSARRAQAGNSSRLPVRECTEKGHHKDLSAPKADRLLH